MSDDTTRSTPYRDATRSVAERVGDLMGRMTLEEKVAQLTGILPFDLLGPAGLSRQLIEQHLSAGVGEISAGGLLSPEPADLIAALNGLQKYLVENTRLGIPAIIHQEALAGVVRNTGICGCSPIHNEVNPASSSIRPRSPGCGSSGVFMEVRPSSNSVH